MSTISVTGTVILNFSMGDSEAAQGTHWRLAAQPATRKGMILAPAGPVLLDLLNAGAAGVVIVTQTDDPASAAAVAEGLPPMADVLTANLDIGAAGSLRQTINPVRKFLVVQPPASVAGRLETLGLILRGPSSLRLATVLEVGDPPVMDLSWTVTPSGTDGTGKPIFPVWAEYEVTTPAGLLTTFPTLARVEITDTWSAWEHGPINEVRRATGLAATGFKGTLRWDEVATSLGYTAKRFGGYNSVTAEVQAKLYDAGGSLLATFTKDASEGGV